MKIAIHANAFDSRGGGKVPLDYALAIRDTLGHEVVLITSDDSPNENLPTLSENFDILTYSGLIARTAPNQIKNTLSRIVDRSKIDFLHMIKAGENDGVTPDNCRTGIHCVFRMSQPHGSVYSAVSAYLARKYGMLAYVPHIIRSMDATTDYRKHLSIPEDALLIGRHGGLHTFDIPFVHDTIKRILDSRSDIYFAFLSTKPFYHHERIRYIPWVKHEQEKFNFIHACDAMLHARSDGETFGIAVGEFSATNKPVITWSGHHAINEKRVRALSYDAAHIEQLQGKAILYTDRKELFSLLTAVSRKDLKSSYWDVFSHEFSANQVAHIYDSVFIKETNKLCSDRYSSDLFQPHHGFVVDSYLTILDVMRRVKDAPIFKTRHKGRP